MNRADLQALSRLRLKEARLLLKHRQFEGAYYLTGYAIECALKAVIAKRTAKYDFPDKELSKNCFVHNLESLRKLSGMENQFRTDIKTNPGLEANWAIVKDWTEQSRYRKSIPATMAQDMYSASASKGGVLFWIKNYGNRTFKRTDAGGWSNPFSGFGQNRFICKMLLLVVFSRYPTMAFCSLHQSP